MLGLVMWLVLLLPNALSAQSGEDAARSAKVDSLYAAYKTAGFPEVPDLSVGDFLKMAGGDSLVLVDVREPAEQAVSMLPGAITMAAFEAEAASYSDYRIVVYCTIGFRSALYTRQLREKGLDAYNLAGSRLAWAHAGQVLVDSLGPTRTAHVYGETWDLLPEGYRSVW